MREPTKQQKEVLTCAKKNMIVSASAGSGKTFIMIKYIIDLLLEKHVPLRRMLILTFTRAAAGEMRERLNKELLSQKKDDDFVLEQIDDLSIADISTIDSFCEKLISRNIDKINLDESFKLMEDTKVLKQKAFENALISFSKTNTQMLNEIFACFRKNKPSIFETMLKLEDFFTYLPKDRIDYFISNQQELYKHSKALLNQKLKTDIRNVLSEIESAEDKVAFEPKYSIFCQVLKNLLSITLNNDFERNVQNLKLIDVPKTPSVTGGNRDEALVTLIKSLRAKVAAIIDDCKKFTFDDETLLKKQQTGELAVALLSLFKVYHEEYASIKEKLDVLDFVDIENLALQLLGNNEVLKQLQEKYDYIFIDEYQDTNSMQESIIKPITEKGHFFAVGDPKQGIYGFRSASMEIMQNDIAKFTHSSHGKALYLTGNFRSDEGILKFVNKIFEKIMTDETVGIDYENTSQLSGEVEFKPTDLPPVRVDIISSAVEPQIKTQPSGIYSVKKDIVQTKDKDALEIDTIIARIDDLLLREIYDEKAEKFRKIEFDDIAILMRSRSGLMNALADKLNAKGYPCYADSKQSTNENGQIQMLLNLLKLLLNEDNDIALISVMNSKLGGFTLDELATLRIELPSVKYFYEVLKQSRSEGKVDQFYNMLEKLRLRAQVKGLSKALRDLFVEKDYFAFLKLEDPNGYMKVLSFLRDIKNRDFDFDVGAAISYFEQVGVDEKNNAPSGSGIKILTIHASKGLEYPVVILAGSGQRLEKPSMRIYELNKELGLCLPAFNQANNTRCTSPNLEAAKLLNKRKEMIDEIMIFYVALTRAKNHLYIVGQEKTQNLLLGKNFDVMKAKNYLSMIAYSFGDQFIEQLKLTGQTHLNGWEFNIVENVENLEISPQQTEMYTLQKEVKENLKEYLNFQYADNEYCLINLKNSVTSLNSHNENPYFAYQSERASIDMGNAYHIALKVLDFEKIVDMDSLNEQIDNKKAIIGESNIAFLDRQLLLQNILLIKNLVGQSKLYKEKPFVMSARVCDISNLDCQDEVLVQGVVDLFALGGENILIDYKFTEQQNPIVILDRYKTQLDLYSRAIEQGFGVKVGKKYILSLKKAKLIEYL